MVFAFDRFERAVMDVGSAVDLVVGGQHLGPLATLGERHLVILPGFAGEVHDDDHLLAILADSHKA